MRFPARFGGRLANPRALLSVLLLAGSTSAAAFHENEVDVMNRPVAPLLSRGRPVLVLYCNRATRWVGESATRMAVRLWDVPFTTLVHVDLRGIPSLFHGIARHTIRRSQEEGVENYRREFRQAGVEPPGDASERLVLVADPDGAAHAAVGLPEGFKESVAVVYDAQGNEVARGTFPRDADRIERAIRDASHR